MSAPSAPEKHWLTSQIHLNFTNIGDLQGGPQHDTIFLRRESGLTGRIDGGSGSNSLQGTDLAHTWEVERLEEGRLLSSAELSFDGASDSVINSINNTITFAVPHHLVTGDRVQYRNGTDQPGGDVQGLFTNSIYQVIRQDDFTIQLTHPGQSAPLSLRPTAQGGNNHGLIKTMTLDSSAIDVDQQLQATVLVFNQPHLFLTGQAVVFRNLVGQSGPLEDGETYFVVKADEHRIALAASVADIGSGRTINLSGLNTVATLTPVNRFFRIGSLFGGVSSDVFNMQNNGVIAKIFGGGGINTLQQERASTWTLTGVDSGETDVVGQFGHISHLIGSDQQDTFVVAANGRLSGSIDGGAGGNRLQSNTANFAQWAINRQNAGIVMGESGSPSISFRNIANLTGSDGPDTFQVADQGVVISIDGRGGSNTIQAANVVNTWSVTGTDTGSVSFLPLAGAAASIAFSDVGNLHGGTQLDRFTLSSAGTLSGAVDGQGGNDVLENAAPSSQTWTLTGPDAGTATGIAGGFTHIANLRGGPGPATFVLDNNGSLSGSLDGGATPIVNSVQIASTNGVAHTWDITGQNAGTVQGVVGSFSNIGQLKGGIGADTFLVGPNGRLSAFNGIDGGGAAIFNTLQIANVNGNAYTWEMTGPDAGNLQGRLPTLRTSVNLLEVLEPIRSPSRQPAHSVLAGVLMVAREHPN